VRRLHIRRLKGEGEVRGQSPLPSFGGRARIHYKKEGSVNTSAHSRKEEEEGAFLVHSPTRGKKGKKGQELKRAVDPLLLARE